MGSMQASYQAFQKPQGVIGRLHACQIKNGDLDSAKASIKQQLNSSASTFGR